MLRLSGTDCKLLADLGTDIEAVEILVDTEIRSEYDIGCIFKNRHLQFQYIDQRLDH